MANADQTRTVLVDALVRLVRERSLNDISVRDIAREAGVNHGLVHRHFGSRDNLVRAATEQVSAEIHASYPDRSGLSCHTFRYLRDRPELVRVLAQACLEGQDALLEAAAPQPERVARITRTIQEALDRLPMPTKPDPHVLNGLAISAILGWLLFKPLLDQGFGLPDDADDQVQGLLDLLDHLATAPALR